MDDAVNHYTMKPGTRRGREGWVVFAGTEPVAFCPSEQEAATLLADVIEASKEVA